MTDWFFSTDETGCFAKYGFEYKPGYGQDSYISWVNNGKKSWTIRAPGESLDEHSAYLC